MKRILPLLLAFLPVMPLTAQVRIDHAIELNSSDPSQRRVSGLRTAIGANEGISVEAYRAGVFATAGTEADAWTVELAGLVGPPVTGMALTFFAPGPLPGPLALRINGNGPYPITWGGDQVVAGSSVTSGSLVPLVFDGTTFQLMSAARTGPKPCTSGSVAVNDLYCMDLSAGPDLVDFFQASNACGERGMRLCSWAEFSAACDQRNALGLSIIGQYEWVGSTCNEDGFARVSGLSSCVSTGCAAAMGGTARAFRCCSDR